MLKCRKLFGLLLAASALASPPAGAQRGALALEASIGSSRGTQGRDYDNRGGIALDALVAWRVHSGPVGAFAIALAYGTQGPLGSDVSCVPILALRSCLDNYPRFESQSLLLGWEVGRPRERGARILLGPGIYQRERPDSARVGVQGRLDLRSASVGPVALVLSVRGAVVPTVNRQTLMLGILGIGFRLQ